MAVALLGLIFLAGFYIGRAVTAILEAWPGAPRPRAEEPKATMLTSTAVLAAGAAVSGGVLALWGARLLPFEEHAPGPAAWRVSAVLLGALGLLLGRTLVRRYGPIAPLRLVALPLEHFVELLFVGAGRLVFRVAFAVTLVEGLLDGGARLVARGARETAWLTSRTEDGFDRLASVAQPGPWPARASPNSSSGGASVREATRPPPRCSRREAACGSVRRAACTCTLSGSSSGSALPAC